MVSLIMMNLELSAKALRESLHTPRLKKQVQFLSIYTLKFISCLNLMKICIYHLEHACIEHKSYVMCTVLLFCSLKEIMTKQYVIFLVCSKKKRNDKKWHIFSYFFEEENVSIAVTLNK